MRGDSAWSVIDAFEHDVERLHRLTQRLGRVARYRRLQLAYAGESTDIFVVSFPKSGTTLVQMLMHQLLTGGSVDFDHISEFSPFLEKDLVTRLKGREDPISDLRAPKVIKTHLPHQLVPRGPGRYVYIVRNGLDVCLSYYHQSLRTGWKHPFPVFFTAFMEGGLSSGSWFEHVRGWLTNRARLELLCVSYEDLRLDFVNVAHRIADFCGASIDENEWPRITKHCSFEFMRDHESKFDDLKLRESSPEKHFIRDGTVNGWRTSVTPAMLAYYRKKCESEFASLDVPRHLIVE